MNAEDRAAIERALGRIPREAWDDFLASEEGRHIRRSLEAVRGALGQMGRLPRGPAPAPTGEIIDMLGHQLLSDRHFGPWVRWQLLMNLAATKWARLADLYPELSGSKAPVLHGNATQWGLGSEIMANAWRRGGRWADAFCKALELPLILARSDADPRPVNEVVEPTVTLGALHDFQVDVYAQLLGLLASGTGRTALLSLPTGAGKTRVAVEALCDHLAQLPKERRHRNVVLWIAPSNELQMQAWACFRQVWQHPPERTDGRSIPRRVPLALVRAWGGVDPDSVEITDDPTVIVAGIDQLASWTKSHPEFFESFPRRRLAGVVVDEAHGLITNEHREVLIALGLRAKRQWSLPLNAPPVIGLSATPWRSHDGQTEALRGYFERALLTPRLLKNRPIETLQERNILARVDWERLDIADTPPMTAAESRNFATFGEPPPEHLERLGAVHVRNARIVERLARKIDYAYEAPLTLSDGAERFPDFTIVDAYTGVRFYWEHLGLLDDPQYAARWERKLAAYRASGILPHDEGGGPNGTLIITRDAPGGALDSARIAKLLEEVFGGD